MSDGRDSTGTGVHPPPTGSSIEASNPPVNISQDVPDGRANEDQDGNGVISQQDAGDAGVNMDLDGTGEDAGVDLGIMEGLVDFDEAFDQHTLANLEALSRLEELGAEDVDNDDRPIVPLEEELGDVQAELEKQDEGAEGDNEVPPEVDLEDVVDFSMFLPDVQDVQDGTPVEESVDLQDALRRIRQEQDEQDRQEDTAPQGDRTPVGVAVEKPVEQVANEDATVSDEKAIQESRQDSTFKATTAVSKATDPTPEQLPATQEEPPMETALAGAAPTYRGVQIPQALPSSPTTAPIEATRPETSLADPTAGTGPEQPEAGPSRHRSPSPPRPQPPPPTLTAAAPTSKSPQRNGSVLSLPEPRPTTTIPEADGPVEYTPLFEKRGSRREVVEDDADSQDERTGEEDGEDGEFEGPKYGHDGRRKRKRNRTVLSCTECHRRKRKIYYLGRRELTTIFCLVQNTVKRGVPSMCRMELPAPQDRKKRKMTQDMPGDYDLGVRVQALESLIRSGSNLDPDSAQSAAMDTILHATRAAESGSTDATSALAQLTNAMGGQGIGNMSQDAQSTLLMDVLQQLSTSTPNKPAEPEEPPPQDKTKSSGKKDMWSSIAVARPDPLARLVSAYDDDPTPTKVNLTLPGFRDNEGKIFVPPTVRYMEKSMKDASLYAEEALPPWGDEAFCKAALKFAYGEDEKRYKSDQVSAVQANTLVGALRIAGTFLARFPTRGRHVYVPSPTTEDSIRALRDAGLDTRYYRFLDKRSGTVDFDGLREDISSAPERSAILLHVGGSIPTGIDLTLQQWKQLISVLQQRNLIPLVVVAFQGLASGDPAADVEPLRLLAHEALPVVLCQNFDSTMGLYADSPSVTSVLAQSYESKLRVEGQLRAVARGFHLHPSPWGAYIARAILSESKLHRAWSAEIKALSDRLKSVREKLFDLLSNKFKTPGTWTQIQQSVGMFCTTMLPPVIGDALTTKRHIHLLPYSCFSLGSLNAQKIEFLARAIDAVVLAHNREVEEAQAQQLAMQIALQAAREAAAREEEEAEAQAAVEEDRRILEFDLENAINAQTRREEDERRREEEERGLEDAVRKAAERAEIARQAEAILASITAGQF